MNYGASASDSTPRKDVVREAISIIVATLGKEDSQASHEAEGGGLRTVTFAGGQAHDLDDLNPRNLKDKWAKIRWAGGTRIMPGIVVHRKKIFYLTRPSPWLRNQQDGTRSGRHTWRNLARVQHAAGHY